MFIAMGGRPIAKEYHVPNELVCFVGTGPGDVPMPTDPIRYEKFVVMIAADFERKRGGLAVAAVTEARKQRTDIGIKFIGAKPPDAVMALPFVEWCGWLDLQKDADRARFAHVMTRAGAHNLLSRVDLTPLAIPEAAVYGMATIATSVGGIPEMIENGKTGWLIDPTARASDIANILVEIFADPALLRAAGEAANGLCGNTWNWASVAEKAVATVGLVIAE